jgi:hypothetical protein
MLQDQSQEVLYLEYDSFSPRTLARFGIGILIRGEKEDGRMREVK